MHKPVLTSITLILLFGASCAFGAGDGEKMYNDLREKNALYRDAEWQD